MPQVSNDSGYAVHSSSPLHPFLRLLLGAFCGVWLYTFLPPMERLGVLNGATTMVPVFVVLVVVQSISWRWVRAVAGLIAIAAYMQYWYVPYRGVAKVLRGMWQLNSSGIGELLHHGVFTNALQTETFLASLCGMFWLITYAARHPRLWTFYNGLSILVLGIVDGNTNVHPNASIVTQLILFVTILGVLQFHRFAAHLIYSGRPTLRFFLPLAALLVFAAGIGSVVPKPGAVWADPLAKFDHGTSGKGPGIRQIGYQLNNSRLGGSFVMNKTPVLSVVTSDSQYLRGAVFSDYTGHGWIVGHTAYQPLNLSQSVLPIASQLDAQSAVPTKTITAKVTVLSSQLNVPVLLAPYEASVLKTDSLPTAPSVAGLRVNTATDVWYGSALAAKQSYDVSSEEMQVPDEVLANLSPLPKETATAFPLDIQHTYLQLPGTLPKSVGQLANRLTSGMTTEYDKVMTIQNYLKSNYSYETTGIPVPGKNQDYVNQFLFDSKKGYCNNFSSSMAVMLRTLGIPTRWVTGFAPGTIDPQYQGSENRYIVTNADAHSWVEVYFPTVGWVPFDPTPNFNMPFAQADASATTTQTNLPTQPHVTLLHPQTLTPQAGGSATLPAVHFPWQTFLRVIGWVLAVLLAGGFGLLFAFRHPFQNWRHVRAWKRDTPDDLQRGVLHLVRLLRRIGELKSRALTLRDLQPAAKSYGVENEEFRQLVRTFERSAYSQHPPTKDELKVARLTWVSWIVNILRRGRR